MNHVVYVLGAGFSAPAGLPVIANFFLKARSQLDCSPTDNPLFLDVFKSIDKLWTVLRYIKVNPENIEEVFSISDMDIDANVLNRGRLVEFIKRVIEFHTPAMAASKPAQQYDRFPDDLRSIWQDSELRDYVTFFACALGLACHAPTDKPEGCALSELSAIVEESESAYRFISLNYDHVVERAVGFLESTFRVDLRLQLAKLHGSAEGDIVPPSWTKSISGDLSRDWRLASDWLRQANEIRILGYSMPENDAHFRHLLALSLATSHHLQLIDVICLDDAFKSVRQRYQRIFSFSKLQFYDADIKEYFSHFNLGPLDRSGGLALKAADPEYFHRRFSDVYRAQREAVPRQ
ncbi:MAG: hypothetical protein U0795_26480 [Pirellulales bacterium]